jgi:predicted flap endonuclease-1-like 5' DNA nuclease
MSVSHLTKRRARLKSIRAGNKREVDVDAFAAAGRKTIDRKRPGPYGVADNLKKLPGVSPAIEKQLNGLGIFHYSQIAALGANAANNVGEEVGLPGRVAGWIAKAKELAGGKHRHAPNSRSGNHQSF